MSSETYAEVAAKAVERIIIVPTPSEQVQCLPKQTEFQTVDSLDEALASGSGYEPWEVVIRCQPLSFDLDCRGEPWGHEHSPGFIGIRVAHTHRCEKCGRCFDHAHSIRPEWRSKQIQPNHLCRSCKNGIKFRSEPPKDVSLVDEMVGVMAPSQVHKALIVESITGEEVARALRVKHVHYHTGSGMWNGGTYVQNNEIWLEVQALFPSLEIKAGWKFMSKDVMERDGLLTQTVYFNKEKEVCLVLNRREKSYMRTMYEGTPEVHFEGGDEIDCLEKTRTYVLSAIRAEGVQILAAGSPAARKKMSNMEKGLAYTLVGKVSDVEVSSLLGDKRVALFTVKRADVARFRDMNVIVDIPTMVCVRDLVCQDGTPPLNWRCVLELPSAEPGKNIGAFCEAAQSWVAAVRRYGLAEITQKAEIRLEVERYAAEVRRIVGIDPDDFSHEGAAFGKLKESAKSVKDHVAGLYKSGMDTGQASRVLTDFIEALKSSTSDAAVYAGMCGLVCVAIYVILYAMGVVSDVTTWDKYKFILVMLGALNGVAVSIPCLMYIFGWVRSRVGKLLEATVDFTDSLVGDVKYGMGEVVLPPVGKEDDYTGWMAQIAKVRFEDFSEEDRKLIEQRGYVYDGRWLPNASTLKRWIFLLTETDGMRTLDKVLHRDWYGLAAIYSPDGDDPYVVVNGRIVLEKGTAGWATSTNPTRIRDLEARHGKGPMKLVKPKVNHEGFDAADKVVGAFVNAGRLAMGLPVAMWSAAKGWFSTTPNFLYSASTFLTGFAAVLTLKHLLCWLIELLPFGFQEWLYNNSPHAVSSYLLTTYGVHDWMAAKNEIMPRLKKDVTVAVVGEAAELLKRGEKIISVCTRMPWNRNLACAVNELRKEIADARSVAQWTEEGREPFWVAFSGASGTGKSNITVELARMLTVCGEITEPDASLVFFKDEDKYWNGLKNQTVAVVDDLFSSTDETQNQAMSSHILHMCSNLPFRPIQADLMDKGNPSLIHTLVTSSNFPFLEKIKGVDNAEALVRRRNLHWYVDFDLSQLELSEDMKKDFVGMKPKDVVATFQSDPRAYSIQNDLMRKRVHLTFKLIPTEGKKEDGADRLSPLENPGKKFYEKCHPRPVYDDEGLVQKTAEGEIVVKSITDDESRTFSYDEMIDYCFWVRERRRVDIGKLAGVAKENVGKMSRSGVRGKNYTAMVQTIWKVPDAEDNVGKAYGTFFNGLLVCGSALATMLAIAAYAKWSEVDVESHTIRARSLETKKGRAVKSGDKHVDHEAGGSSLAAREKVGKNQVVIRRDCGTAGKVVMNALFLNDHEILIPTHFWVSVRKVVADDLITIERATLSGGYERMSFRFNPTKLRVQSFERQYTDISIYNTETPVIGFRSIVSCFARKEDVRAIRPDASVVRTVKLLNGQDVVSKEYAGAILARYDESCFQDSKVDLLNGRKVVVGPSFEYKVPSCPLAPGHCGAPVFMEEHPFLAVGIHTASAHNGTVAYMSQLSRDLLEELQVGTDTRLDDEEAKKIGGSFQWELGILGARPGVNCPPGNVAEVFSTDLAHEPNTKTELRKTPAFGVFGPPNMAPSVKRSDMVLSEEAKHLTYRLPVEGEYLRYGAAVAREIYGVSTNTPKRLLDESETVNGFEGSPGLDMSKSPGYPHVSRGLTRKALFEEEANGKWRMRESFRAEFARIEQLYADGRMVNATIAPDLKDELLKESKIIQGRCRTFEKCPMWLVCLVRKYFGAFCEHLTRTRGRSSSCIGMDKGSRDWHEMWTRLRNFLNENTSNAAFDGDYEAWEALCDQESGHVVADVVTSWYGDDLGKVRRNIVSTYLESYMVWKNYVWVRRRGMPSGVPVTAPLNTVFNQILLAGMFKKIAKMMNISVSPRDYLDNIMCILYGDDNVNAVKPAAREIYNFLTVRRALAEYNFKLTPADKTDDETKMKPLVDLMATTFLKSSPRWDHLFHSYVAAPDWGRFYNSIYWTRGKKREDFQNALRSFMLEIVGLGRDKYEEISEQLKQVLSKVDAEVIPDWESQAERYGYDVNYLPVVEYKSRGPQIDDFVEVGYESDVVREGDTTTVGALPDSVVTTHPLLETPMPTQESSFQRWAKNPIYLASVDVSSGTAFGVNLYQANVPTDVILAQNQVSVTNNIYWRGTLHVRAQTQSSGWKSGCAILYFNPFSDKTEAPGIERAWQLNHVFIDYSSTKPVELVIPFQHQVNAWTGNLPISGSIRMDTVNPIVSQTGSSASASVRLDCWWDPVEFFLPIPTSTLRMERMNEVCFEGASVSSQQKNRDTGPINAGPGATVNVITYDMSSDCFKADTSQSTSASAAVSKGGDAKSESKQLGQQPPVAGHAEIMDQPNHTVPPILTHQGRWIRATADGTEYLESMGDFAAENVSPQPRDFGTDVDEMSFRFFLDKEGYMATINWPESATTGTLLWRQPISITPVLMNANLNSVVKLTPTEFVASFFRYWRGNLKYTIRIVGPATYSGQLLVVLGYGLWGSSPSMVDATSVKKVVFNFDADHREFVVETEWNTIYDWLKTCFGGYGGSLTPELYTLGNMFIYVSTPLAGPAGFAGATNINISFSAGDMVFSMLAPSQGLSSVPPVLIPPSTEKRREINHESGEVKEQPPAVVNSGMDGPKPGSSLTHFMDVWKKPYSLGIVDTIPGRNTCVVINPCSFLNTELCTPDGTTYEPVSSTAARIADCYALWKGGAVLNIAVVPADKTDNNIPACVVQSMVAYGNYNYFPGVFSNSSVPLTFPEYQRLPLLDRELGNLYAATHNAALYNYVGQMGGLNGVLSFRGPGIQRISLPWCSMLKSLGVRSSSLNTAESVPDYMLCLFIRDSEESDEPKLWKVIVWAQPQDDTRCGVWSGVPDQLVGGALQPPSTQVSYPGDGYSFLPPPENRVMAISRNLRDKSRGIKNQKK